MKNLAIFFWFCVVFACLFVSIRLHAHYTAYIGYFIPLLGLPWNLRRLRKCEAGSPRVFAWTLPPPVFFCIGLAVDFKVTALS